MYSDNGNGDLRPHIEVEIGDIKILGLLDSGADCTILGGGCEQLIEVLNIEKHQSNLIIRTADGSYHTISEYCTIPFKFHNQTHQLRTLIMPSLSKKLILGLDFWKLFGFEIKMCNSLTYTAVMDGDVKRFNREEIYRISKAINSFPKSIEGKLNRTNVLVHKVETGDAIPIKQRYYNVSPYIQKEMDTEFDRMLKLGVIEPSKSAWSSPMVAVRKSSGKIRLCLDSRKLNEVTVKDSYPMPYMTRILGNLRGTKFLSKIDLKDAYWQIPLSPESKDKTAFTIPGRGLFQFCVTPFGLCNAGQSQCRLMDRVLGFDMEPYVFVYLDDIVVATDDFNQHIKFLEQIADRLSKAGLSVNIEKSQFFVEKLHYLGHVIDNHGIHTDQAKVECIVNYPAPKSVKEVRRFIGFSGWYRRFIYDFATFSAPITDLLKEPKTPKSPKVKFVWTAEAEDSFQKLKLALSSAPVLATPNFDLPFVIQTDASDVGLAGVLVQGSGEEERVIAYMSQKFTSAQRKYSTTERECLAVLAAIEHFRPYIEGAHFTVITDHASLVWLQNLKNPNGRLGRWILRLQQYTFKLLHRKGKHNIVPDALSRAMVDEIHILSENFNGDPWYDDLREKLKTDSDKYPDFRLEGDVILKHCSNKCDVCAPFSSWKIVLPVHLRTKVMFENHDTPTSSHFGYYKTLKRIQASHYWPKMTIDIRQYVADCDQCKANKDPTYITRSPMGEAKVLNTPWHTIAIDFLGPLPRSKKGNTYLFVVLDCFSKFTILTPLRKADTSAAIRILESDVFFKFGIPSVLISDNGPQFISKAFKKFIDEFKVKHWLNAAYHPQHNPAERPNKVIAAAIRNYIGTDHKNWDQEIPQIACAINTATHQSTKFTPFYLNFGRNMSKSGADHSLDETLRNDDEAPSATDVVDRLADVHSKVVSNLNQAYREYSHYYNLRSRKVSFAVDEIVWLRNFKLSDAAKQYSAKLGAKYIKCRVSKVIGSSTYALKNLNGKPLGNFNVKDLKKD